MFFSPSQLLSTSIQVNELVGSSALRNVNIGEYLRKENAELANKNNYSSTLMVRDSSNQERKID